MGTWHIHTKSKREQYCKDREFQHKDYLIELAVSEVVKSGSSLGQSPGEFQIKGARMEEQR